MTVLSRRRFLSISAACMALPAGAKAAPVAHWRGTALGARASLQLSGLTDDEARPVISAIEAELHRLENIFSLYRPDSELSRLNRDGMLTAPAPELLNVLSLCAALHDASGGAFDPSVQPLWLALASGADESVISSARQLVGWHQVTVTADHILLPQPGVSALTLNGIAQGAVTDRIADLLRSMGLGNVLVDMGEIAALGANADGRHWRVGLAGPDGAVLKRIGISDRAVATSAPGGSMLMRGQGHILSPDGSKPLHRAVSVSAPRAAIADGLSTALCLIPKTRVDTVLDRFPGSRIEMMI